MKKYKIVIPKRQFTFYIEKTKAGYSAYCAKDKDLLSTTGKTMDELYQNIHESVNLYILE